MYFRLCLFVLATLSGASAAFACSIPGMPPSRFDRSQNVFHGEVTGYVSSGDPVKRSGSEKVAPTAGIVVRVSENLFSPGPPDKFYEVYRFGLGAGCELLGIDLKVMKSLYPLGKFVRVAAGQAFHLQPSLAAETGRLELRFSSNDFIGLQFEQGTPLSNSFASFFDYEKYRTDLMGDPYFELWKDMYRLEFAKSEDERAKILNRLTFFPRDGFFLYEMFKQYTVFPDEFDRYSDLARKRAMTPAEYKLMYERLRQKEQKTKALLTAN